MKAKLLIATTLLFSLSSHASEWNFLAHSPSGDKSYAMLNTPSNIFPVIWYKTTTAKGVTQAISKDVIDCKKQKYAIRSIDKYDSNGAITLSESHTWLSWQEITPDSMASFEYGFACK